MREMLTSAVEGFGIRNINLAGFLLRLSHFLYTWLLRNFAKLSKTDSPQQHPPSRASNPETTQQASVPFSHKNKVNAFLPGGQSMSCSDRPGVETSLSYEEASPREGALAELVHTRVLSPAASLPAVLQPGTSVQQATWTQHHATPAPPAERTHAQGKGDYFVNEAD